ncbi:MAG: hypothetical protein ACR2GK_05370, partial [Gemmatimonadaceae bacterium]
YAHNDYENARPLDEALERGFRGVEVDLFLVDGTLQVGHDRRRARAGATFEALYLAPLRALVTRCGMLRSDGQPFLLAVELKEGSQAAYNALVHLLGRYQPLFAGTAAGRVLEAPVEIVLVGWYPPGALVTRGADSLLQLQYRLTRPGPLSLRDPARRVRLVSVDYGKTIGRWWGRPAHRRRWIATLHAVKGSAPGRLLRVHNVPRDATVYYLLLDAGVDLIGTKDLARTQSLLSQARGGLE